MTGARGESFDCAVLETGRERASIFDEPFKCGVDAQDVRGLS